MASGGIIQWIKFQLDKNSVKIAEQEARDAGRKTAAAMVEALAKGDAASQATAKFVEKLQQQFDAKVTKIQDKIIQGLGDEKTGQKAADRLVKAYNEKLADGIAKLNPGMRSTVLEKTVKGLSFGAVDISQGIEGGGLFGQEDLNKLRRRVQDTFQQIRNDWTNVWNIPAARDISKSLDRQLRKQAKNDADEYRRLVKQAVEDQQIASSTLTPLGKLYRGFGVDVANLHPLLQKSTTATAAAAGAFKGLLKQLGLVVTAYQALRFAISSVKDFAEQDAQYARLSNTLGDFGIRLSTVEPQIRKLIEANLNLGYTNKETVEVFSTLMQLTGDYERSLKAVSVVLDLYRGTTMSMTMATRSVARAMVGSNESLNRQGIYLDENKDALDQLTARFGGEALARATSYAGALDRIHAEWTQLKITIGQQLVTGGGGKTWLDEVVAALIGMRHWIQENRITVQAFGGVASATFRLLAFVVNLLNSVFKAMVINMGAIRFVLISFTPFMQRFWGSFFTSALEGFQKLAGVVDTFFNTKLKSHFDNAVKWAQNLRDKANSDFTFNKWEFVDWAKMIWNGTANQSDGPLAPDNPLGHAHGVTTRVHQKITKDIAATRNAGLVNDIDDQEKALEELNTQLQKMQQAADDTKDDYKEQKLWLDHVHQIQAAILDIQKKQADESDRRKAAQKLAHEIELNGQLLLGTRDKERASAARELDRLEGLINEKLKKQTLSKDEILELEKEIGRAHV